MVGNQTSEEGAGEGMKHSWSFQGSPDKDEKTFIKLLVHNGTIEIFTTLFHCSGPLGERLSKHEMHQSHQGHKAKYDPNLVDSSLLGFHLIRIKKMYVRDVLRKTSIRQIKEFLNKLISM